MLKIIRIGLYFIVLGMILVIFLSYQGIKHATKRPRYTTEKIKEHEANRSILLKEFNAQPLTFMTEDGLNLSGLLLVREGAQRTLLICHGYRMCKERLLPFASMFPHDNIFLFDHRAHGQSDGSRVTIGYEEPQDVLAAARVVQSHEKTKNLPLYGIGISMGAVSLLAAACQEKIFSAIILDSPFGKLDVQARRVFSYKFKLPFVPFEAIAHKIFEYCMQFSLGQVDSFSSIKDLTTPVMIIHSVFDSIASLQEAYKIFETAPCKKEMWIVHASRHAYIFSDCSEEYRQRVDEFFKTA
ncbi:MAG: alpha/beta hydrolase [Candidatus Babeliales bacterium]